MVYGSTPAAPQGLSAFGDWFSEVFRLWGARWQVWVVQGLVYCAIAFLPAVVAYIVMIGSLVVTSIRSPQGEPSDLAVLGAMGAMYGLLFLGSFIALALYPGMVKTALKQMRGEEIRVGDIFSGMRYFWGALVVGFVTGLGILACGLGIYILMGLLFLAVPLMVDRGLPTGEAISQSWKTTTTNFWLYVLFAFIVTLMSGLGTMACYIGIIATIPFLPIAQAVAYERTLMGAQSAETPGAVMPPPPYIPPPPEAE